MKFTKSFWLAAALISLSAMFPCQSLRAAVVFSVTPAAVSNTYSGNITFQITGLTNTETVVVQKFLDSNTNGLVDGPDLLVQQFNLSDGTNFVIGGATNINVPGDLNSTTGAITASLNFKNGDFVQGTIGRYIFNLSSPVGHFAPITNLFDVTNFPFAQKITGNVVSSGTNVPNAVVLLFSAPRAGNHGPGSPQVGAVANNSGSYTIQAPPGTYMPVAFKNNYLANFTASPLITLGGGQTITTNLTLTNATASISGRLVDAINPTIGLPGIFGSASDNNGFVAIAFTDTNGNSTLRVRSGQWKIGNNDGGLIVHGYVGYQNSTNINTTSGDVTNLVFPIFNATALFYGSVKDNLGNPLAGIDVVDQDEFGLFEMDGYSDANGNYAIGAVGDLGGGDTWEIQVDDGGDNSNPTNYIFSDGLNRGMGTNLASGKAVLFNFVAILATNRITGHVQDDQSNPISGVQIFAYANIGGLNYQAQADTDTNGNYSLKAANGNWNVNVSCDGGDDSLSGILGNGNYVCPDSQNVNIVNANGAANFTVQSCNGVQIITTSPLPGGQVGVYYDFALQASSCYSGFDWSQSAGTLPPDLTLYSDGELNGTPSAGGTFNFTAEVTDGNSNTTNRIFSLTINANTNPPPPLTIASVGSQSVIFWPTSGSNYVLEMTTNLASGNWVPATDGVQVIAFTFTNNLPAAFFRLH